MGEPFMGLNEALIDQNLIDEFEQSLENQETPASSLPMIPVTTSELNSLIADTADENGSSGQLVRNSKKKRDSDGIVLVDDRDTSLTCIDLTDDSPVSKDNDIIIEKHVNRQALCSSTLISSTGLIISGRRQRMRENRHNNTIVIDDDCVSRADNDNLLQSPPKRNRLDKNIKESKPNKESEQSEQGLPIQCPICLESLDEIKKNNKRLKSTFCGHILCNECLDATFKSNSISNQNKAIFCPTCRTKLTKAKIHDLYL